MGKVFGFVSSDVLEKVKILEAFRQGDHKTNFETFKTMMEHEKESNLLEKKGYVSGSRTLLRLHRGMGTYVCLTLIISAEGEGWYLHLLSQKHGCWSPSQINQLTFNYRCIVFLYRLYPNLSEAPG